MKFHIKRVLLSTCLGGFLSFAPVQATADSNWEFSLSGYGGRALVEGTNIQFSHDTYFTATGTTELSGELIDGFLTDSYTVGGRGMAWWSPPGDTRPPNVGFGLEGFFYSTDFPAQTLAGTSGSLIVVRRSFTSPIKLTAQALVFNVAARYPVGVTAKLPHGRWSPYVSVGIGVQRTHAEFIGVTAVDLAPAFQGTAGINVFLNQHVSIFAEYKRSRSTPDVVLPDDLFVGKSVGLEIPLDVNHVLIGLTIHL